MRDDGPMSVETESKRNEGGFAETVRVVIHALIIALVSIALVASLTALSGGIRGTFTNIVAQF